jgi:hypothetical protein
MKRWNDSKGNDVIRDIEYSLENLRNHKHVPFILPGPLYYTAIQKGLIDKNDKNFVCADDYMGD